MTSQADTCPYCKYHTADWEDVNFDEKLGGALKHPDTSTRRRAAWLLGERRAATAFMDLLNAFKSSSDPYFKAEIIRTLIKINRQKTKELISQKHIEKESIIVQKAFAEINVE
jgi:HEAT repeat protein